MSWEQLCRQKQVGLADRIPQEWRIEPVDPSTLDVRAIPATCGILTPLEIEITELDEVDDLLHKLRTGAWSCVQVTKAYLKRALIAHQLVNCLTEFWIDDALARAQELDETLATSGPLGPLHGLPISLKDQFHVKGKELNMGFASWIGQISPADAALVTLLRKAGAVIYTRTNVPQTLMKPETDNHVYGVTVNPWNRNLTPGGSSGGEGALLALKGSPLGVGTDVGGSVRIPASFNGLYGIKPVCRRVPYAGAANTMMGSEGMESSIGPLARTLKGCATFLRAVAWSQPWDLDPNVNFMLWDEAAYRLNHLEERGGRLCFGYFIHNGHMPVLPPVRRALEITIKALQAKGHTGTAQVVHDRDDFLIDSVIPWETVNYPEMIDLATSLYAAGGSADFAETMKASGEPRREGVRMRPDPGLSVYQYWQLVKRRNELRAEHLRQWMKTVSVTGSGRPIDGLICPVAPWSAPPLGNNIYGACTTVQNLLDLPSVTIPVTTVDASLDGPQTLRAPVNEMDAYHLERYQADLFENGPVGIQLVGRRNREEELLAVATVVDQAIRAM